MCLYLGNGKKLKINTLGGVFRVMFRPSYVDRGYVLASSVGISSANSGDKNMDALAKAVNGGQKIFMDVDNVVLSGEDVKITNDMYIAADPNRRCSITVEATSKALCLTSSVHNVVIENLDVAGSDGVLFGNSPAEYNGMRLDLFSVRNCMFDSIGLYRQNNDHDYSSDKLSYIKEFAFVGNTVRTQSRTFCTLSDVMFDLVSIRDNYFNNFYYILFNIGTIEPDEDATDQRITAYETIKTNKNNLVIKRNTVFNDFDWVQTEVKSLYHAFVVAECDSCEYTNNHVEGLKASVNIALYDIYASCHFVRSENNVWKNNLCFADDHDNCTLMKAKHGGGNKIYCGNQYVIEQEYVDKLKTTYNATDTGLWVDLMSIMDDAAWEVYNNTIDLAVRLTFFYSSVWATKVDICNNSISALAYNGALTARSVQEEAYWTFSNNIITSISHEYRSEPMYLVTNTGIVAGKTEISHNTINIPYQRVYGRIASGNHSIDARYAVTDNEFAVSALRFVSMATFTNNTIVGYNYSENDLSFNAFCGILGLNQDGKIIPYQKMQFILDTSEYMFSSIPMLLYLPEDRIVEAEIKLSHTTNGVTTRCHVQFSTTSDGVLTIKDITDENNVIIEYQGAIRPDAKITYYFCSRLFRMTLQVPSDENASSYIQVKGEPGIFDVDYECRQYEFQEV